MLNPSSLGRDGAPKLAYQSGYNFGFLIYVVQGAFAQFESKIGGGVIGPTYYYLGILQTTWIISQYCAYYLGKIFAYYISRQFVTH